MGLPGRGLHQKGEDGAGSRNGVGRMAAELSEAHGGVDALRGMAGCGEDGLLSRSFLAQDGWRTICASGAEKRGIGIFREVQRNQLFPLKPKNE